MAKFNPRVEHRELFTDKATEAVCLFVDIQNYNLHADGPLLKADPHAAGHVLSAVEACVPKWKALQKRCRETSVEVMYTVIQSLTKDGRDRSLDYKNSGFHVPPGSWEAQVLEALEPGEDEIVLPKTSSSVFLSTNLDYILRCMEKKHLIVAGCLTSQCISHAVKDACDLNYAVTVVTDCCLDQNPERHDQALKFIAGYCRQRTLAQFLPDLEKLH